MHTCIHTYLCICLLIPTHTHTYQRVRRLSARSYNKITHMYIYIYMHTYIHTYIYIYIYICVRTLVYTFTYMFRFATFTTNHSGRRRPAERAAGRGAAGPARDRGARSPPEG